MLRKRHFVVFWVALITSGLAAACTTTEQVRFASGTDSSNEIEISGDVFIPNGAGPFPAVVVLHGCGGVDAHHIGGAKQFVE